MWQFVQALWARSVKYAPAGQTYATGSTVQAAIAQLDAGIVGAVGGSIPSGPAGGVLGGTYPNPGFAVDMATQAELDAAIQGLSWKQDVKCATASPAAYTYLSGVVTFTATGVVTFDGHALLLGERVAIIDGTLAAGIYDVTTAGALGVAGVLTRSADANANTELYDATFNVELGTANGGRTLHCVTDPITLGSTAISFTDIPSYLSPGQAGEGIDITTNVIRKKAGISMSVYCAYSPQATGGDAGLREVPYSTTDGTTAKTFNVRRISLTLSTNAGIAVSDTVSVKLQKSTDGGATWADIGTVSTSAASAANKTSSFTNSTVASGDLIRANNLTLGANTTNWNLSLLLEQA